MALSSLPSYSDNIFGLIAGLSTCIGSEMVKCSAQGANWEVEARCPDDSMCYTIPNVDPAAKPFVATTVSTSLFYSV